MGSPAVTVVAEIVGPPGSGKSTLETALAREGIRTSGNYLSARRAPGWAVTAAGALPVLREAAAAGFGRRELMWIVRLGATPRILASELADARTAVFDQGPVFALVRLRERIGDVPRLERTRAWWAAQLAFWRDRLDLVVHLDADDATLLERIRAREKEHEIRGLDDDGAVEALARERDAYRAVLDGLAEGRCRIARVDTGAEELGATVDRVVSELRSGARG
jgi:hypothetical protein